MATISTHVLDVARGLPAEGIVVGLFALEGGHRRHVATAHTNRDGRTEGPLAADVAAGSYELLFAVTEYFAREGTAAFFDAIPIRFRVEDPAARYHIPLLLSPWGYSAYRGS
ncbi:MAG TPA: hydroxyisourate hydrolase [Candidatus Elarobacter sp.]|jgi:5-hydroxyisourate hydrolase|nr:hydroxyisourate hydrolase [Candidatus Elarobacter sp.]